MILSRGLSLTILETPIILKYTFDLQLSLMEHGASAVLHFQVGAEETIFDKEPLRIISRDAVNVLEVQ